MRYDLFHLAFLIHGFLRLLQVSVLPAFGWFIYKAKLHLKTRKPKDIPIQQGREIGWKSEEEYSSYPFGNGPRGPRPLPPPPMGGSSASRPAAPPLRMVGGSVTEAAFWKARILEDRQHREYEEYRKRFHTCCGALIRGTGPHKCRRKPAVTMEPRGKSALQKLG